MQLIARIIQFFAVMAIILGTLYLVGFIKPPFDFLQLLILGVVVLVIETVLVGRYRRSRKK